MIAGLACALALVAVVPLTRPLGPLAGTMTLVLVLPPLARALVSLGWADQLACQLGGVRGRAAGLAPFGSWVAVSALLTLDVAAVLAAPVGLRLADGSGRGRREQLMAAIVGANGGSLLFPFSNLTNLIVVSGTGVAFGAYVTQAVLPQLAIVVVAGVILARRKASAERPVARSAAGSPIVRSAARSPIVCSAARHRAGRLALGYRARRLALGYRAGRLALGYRAGRLARELGTVTLDRSARIAGVVAVLGALAAVGVGLAGGDVAVPFAAVSAVVVGLAVAAGHETPGRSARAVPLSGVVVVLAAALTMGPATALAATLAGARSFDHGAIGALSACLSGGLLAAGFNNLPAAAFGAVWLRGDPASTIVAFLVGTNVVCLATPHGSLATILARSIAARAGQPLAVRPYLRAAWPFALLPAGAAMLVLAVVR